MINRENLTEEQFIRFDELHNGLGMDIFDWFKMEQEPYERELFDEITAIGTEMIALIRLYKEQLEKNGQMPLSVYNEGFQNLNIVIDSIEEEVIALLPKDSVVNKKYINTEGK